jgi:splicing factor 3A subunit 2
MSFLDAREHGSKPGSGFVSAQQEAVDRRERLRRLALETIDLSKDPYFMRNHLGQYECRLCLTLHTNEGNYLAHTQGKRHQQNLAKRAAREAAEKPVAPAPQRRVAIKKTVRIGRPGYRVTKQFDGETGARGLLFQIEYPEIEEGSKPRHRIMSSYEQRKEPWSKEWQYLLFAAEPYVSCAGGFLAAVWVSSCMHGTCLRGAYLRGPSQSHGRIAGPLARPTLQQHRMAPHVSHVWRIMHLPRTACPPVLLHMACLMQEVVAFKIPSYEVEKHPERLFTHWDPDNKVYSLQLPFKPPQAPAGRPAAPGGVPPQQLPPPPQMPPGMGRPPGMGGPPPGMGGPPPGWGRPGW